MTILKDFTFECRNDTGPYDQSDCSTRLWLTTPHLFCFHTQTAIHHREQVWDQCRIELSSIVLTNDGNTNEFWEFLASRWKQKTLKCHCVLLAVAAQPEEVISSHVNLNTFIEPVNCSKHWKQRMGFISQVLNLFTGESWMFCVCCEWCYAQGVTVLSRGVLFLRWVLGAPFLSSLHLKRDFSSSL